MICLYYKIFRNQIYYMADWFRVSVIGQSQVRK